jgi:tetratricopeptide (TPR) repeat protein
MTATLREQAIHLVEEKRYGEALPLFQQLISEHPGEPNLLYWAGQCHRFMNNFPSAVECLSKAVQLEPKERANFLALGIAFQLSEQFDEAVDTFKRAIALDPDYVVAYNSLALTQKKMGHLETAIKNYDNGLKALAREIVRGMVNSRNNRIFKHRPSTYDLWAKYALAGAMYLSAADKLDGVAFPTGEQAAKEERTKEHEGLYWVDYRSEGSTNSRLFLPNYFSTFREILRSDKRYSLIIANIGNVFDLLNQRDEARKHYVEAEEFA